MRWKQFFTPVKSYDTQEAKNYMSQTTGEGFTLLDVRQPAEYESEHIPGAKLIPLPDLSQRFGEIDADRPTIVYCATGGRSRVAAQMLAAKGFTEVINLSGGIKAWKSEKAVGPPELGLDLFSGKESPQETLVVAYLLEEGLREFYLSMISRVTDDNARRLFEKLADIEVKHQDRIFDQYLSISGDSVSREEFASSVVLDAMEGGLTTDQYLQLYQPDLDVPAEVVSLAMAIEAQALDLYQRASERAETETTQKALMQIANEERSHLQQLGTLFDNF